MFRKSKEMKFAEFMASPAGRGIRIAAGLGIIMAGLSRRDPEGVVIAAVGVVPVVAGVLNVCMLAPFLDVPFRGDAVS